MRPELTQFVDEVRALTPIGCEIVDAHAHLGVDEDGRRLDPERLVRQMDRAGVTRACVFALHDPDRRPAYTVPNDRVLAWAAAAADRFVPYCRVDPADGAAGEIARCLRAGARGVKLHPRAESPGDVTAALDPIFAAAAEARVPVLVHAGRGLRDMAGPLCDVALRHPDAPLVLAHAGVADLATFAHRLADHPSSVFDSSVFGPIDLMELFARVPAERIVFGSDPPYGRVLLGLWLTLRAARASGASALQLRGILGGTMSTLLAGGALPPPGAPLRTRDLALPGALARVATHLAAAFPLAARGMPEAGDSVELARSACRDPAPGPCEPALTRLAEILATVAAALVDPGSSRPPTELIYLAMCLAVTEPSAPA